MINCRWQLFVLRMILPAACLLFSQYSRSQSFIFTPATLDSVKLISLKDKFEKIYKQEISNFPSETKKDLTEIYTQRWENVKDKFEKKEIYTSTPAQDYLDGLVNEVVKANPMLASKDFHCFFSRSDIPNASSIGEGVIIFHMGLFEKLANESQVVFVLCHELSHFLLQHGEKKMKKYVETVNSDQVQSELKKINEREFKKREILDKLVKNISFNSFRHSRDHESEADSMAVELMKGTRFRLSEALSALAMLDSIDVATFKVDACLKNMFDNSKFPFQKNWLAKEEGLLGGHAGLETRNDIADSMKTHPDCSQRIKYITALVRKYESSPGLIDMNRSAFLELQNIFRYEVVEYAYQRDDYTKSLYYTIGLLQTHPDDAYLVTRVGMILNQFYLASKNHMLGKVVELPSPYREANYNLLLQFVQNLYREDYAAISYHYLESYKAKLSTYQPYINTLNKSQQLYNNY